MLELLGLAHQEFLINLKVTFMYDVWELFNPTLLMDIEERLFIRWVVLYALTSV
jgi:hypothetical protein